MEVEVFQKKRGLFDISCAARFFSDGVAQETILNEKIMNGRNPLQEKQLDAKRGGLIIS